MKIFRLILSEWAKQESPDLPKTLEGEFTDEEITYHNARGYNCYWFPNGPSHYEPGTAVDGSQIDQFKYVFVDCDLKDKVYASKEEFLEKLLTYELPPTMVVDSGHGLHAYWAVSDLDALSYVKLQRNLCRYFATDEAVGKICQLMRVPGTINVKNKDHLRPCEALFEEPGNVYTAEQLSATFPPLSAKDQEYCKHHYEKTYKLGGEVKVNEELPRKFLDLLRASKEVKQLYQGSGRDRSKGDYKLAHLLYADNFTRDEAMSVMVNCRKALDRAPAHRISYAANIVDKIWEYEKAEDKSTTKLSKSVKDILRAGGVTAGTRFQSWDIFDRTESGFRLTQVMGLIGGSGSGKTTFALNMFYHFALRNPSYTHVFVSLEQPEGEIAQRWLKIAGEDSNLHDRIHVLGNYNPDGTYRNLSLPEIEDYIVKLKEETGTEIGCVCIDHVGVLRKESRNGEGQALIDIFHQMKAFANRTKCFLMMQSQTSREKAGNGDQEIGKDGAYGSTVFEWYCDYVVTTWQPLKRIYPQAPHLTCSAFAMPKIRHKNTLKDRITEEDNFVLKFDPATERLREMTQQEESAYDFYASQASTLRNKDRKREPKKMTKLRVNTGKDIVKHEGPTEVNPRQSRH